MRRKAILIRGKNGDDEISNRCTEADLLACGWFLKYSLGGCWEEDEIKVYDCSEGVKRDELVAELESLVKVDYAFIAYFGTVDKKTTKWGRECICFPLGEGVSWDSSLLEFCARATILLDCCRNCEEEPDVHFSEWMDPATMASKVSRNVVRKWFDQFVMESEEGMVTIHAEELPFQEKGNNTFTHALLQSAVSWRKNQKGRCNVLCTRDATLLAKKYLKKEGRSRQEPVYSMSQGEYQSVRAKHFPFAISC